MNVGDKVLHAVHGAGVIEEKWREFRNTFEVRFEDEVRSVNGVWLKLIEPKLVAQPKRKRRISRQFIPPTDRIPNRARKAIERIEKQRDQEPLLWLLKCRELEARQAA